MIANNVHLYTWVDVKEVLLLAQKQNDWPEELVWARTYWDSLNVGIRPDTEQEVLSWLADKFTPRFSNGSSSYILLESPSGEPRRLEILLEETEEVPLHIRSKPRLTKPPVVWPPHEDDTQHPAPLAEELPPVVVFHSMSGGTERTLLSMGYARALRSRGKPVLLIDGDLESPKLTWLLGPKSQNLTVSLADFLALVHSSPNPMGTESIQLVAERSKPFFFDGVYVLPAFRFDSPLASLEIKPPHLIQGLKDPFALTTMLAKLGQLLDVQAVIVDLRSGLSELSAWLLLDPRVYRVLVTSQSGPAIAGTCYLLRVLAEAAPAKHKHEPLPALIVTTQSQDEALQAQVEKQLFDAFAPLLAQKGETATNCNMQTTFLDAQFTTLPSEWDEVVSLIEDSTLIEQIQPLVDWLAKKSLMNETRKEMS